MLSIYCIPIALTQTDNRKKQLQIKFLSPMRKAKKRNNLQVVRK